MSELERGYLSFLVNLSRIYVTAEDLIQKEIKHFTKGELEDALVFFLLCFGDVEKIENFEIKDKITLKKYISLEEPFVLTQEGSLLRSYLLYKISAQASNLEFNGIGPLLLAQAANISIKFCKFWSMIANTAKE